MRTVDEHSGGNAEELSSETNARIRLSNHRGRGKHPPLNSSRSPTDLVHRHSRPSRLAGVCVCA